MSDVRPGNQAGEIRLRFARVMRLVPLVHMLQMLHVRSKIAPPRRPPKARTAIATLMVLVLLGAAACSSGGGGTNKGRKPVPPAARLTGAGVVSYAAAASRLEGMDPGEAQEQVRDWARAGLASLLELDTPRFRDAFYDTAPVRDAAFSDLAEQPTGPGRALYDGRDVLHVLVPADDPHPDRTIGLLLDDYRTNSGADPAKVSIHRYQVDSQHRTIVISAEDPAPAADVRRAHGYVEMRVDTPEGLNTFLTQTEHLSLLEDRRGEIWAGGWHWPGIPGGQLNYEDVSVVQRGYFSAPPDPRPGFSLDPGPDETPDDVRAVAPGASNEVVDLVLEQARNAIPSQPSSSPPLAVPNLPPNLLVPPRIPWEALLPKHLDPSDFLPDQSAPEPPRLFDSVDKLQDALWAGLIGALNPKELARIGLPSDRAQLWALHWRAEGHPLYSRARFDGKLKGTEVGMTLFYTDMVAKDWSTGVGSGVPVKAVAGFVPDAAAAIPPGHCPTPEEESGRLWFGQNESGFAFGAQRVSIGAHATRLFARSDGEGASEVEPSFAFGRGLRWWDQHFQEIADYEPQYHRLDQIMRWSGALEWLIARKHAELPHLSDDAIRSGLTFHDWYKAHNELRERSPVDFVSPPSAGEEAILAKPSTPFVQCNPLYRIVEGGVSFGDLIEREGGRTFDPELPSSLRRAGLFDESSKFDAATGMGQIDQMTLEGAEPKVSLARTLSMKADRAIVEIKGLGRKVLSLGELKIARAETATRQMTTELEAGSGRTSQLVSFQGQELGEQVTRKLDATTTTIEWREGPLGRAGRSLGSLQERLNAGTPPGQASPESGVLWVYKDVSGRSLYRVGERDWMTITDQTATPGEPLVLRLGAPNPKGDPTPLEGSLTQTPDVGAEWIEAIPNPGHPATIVPGGPPDSGATSVPVSTPDGRTSTIRVEGDRLKVPANDRILGIKGTSVGAALIREFPRVQETMRTAPPGPALRAVGLGDAGVAFVDAKNVIVAEADHAWSDRFLQAFDPTRPDLELTFLREGNDMILHVTDEGFTAVGPPHRTGLGKVMDEADVILYVSKDLRHLFATEQGPRVPDMLARQPQVVAREATVADSGSAWQPDVRVHESQPWFRVSPNLGGLSGSGGSNPTTSPGMNPGAPNGMVGNQRVVLLCPAHQKSNSTECNDHR